MSAAETEHARENALLLTVYASHCDVVDRRVALITVAAVRLEDESERVIDRAEPHADVIPPAHREKHATSCARITGVRKTVGEKM